MSNPFQDQLLKTGLVSKQQVHKAKQDQSKKNKQQPSRKEKIADETRLKVEQAAKEKEKRDRELNKQKQEKVRQKSITVEINQLIASNCLARDENCEIAYNFDHNNKINRIYIDAEMKQLIIQGKLGIALIEGRYELVPQSAAEKIRQRDENRIVIFSADQSDNDGDYSAEKHQIPDDLTW